MKKTTLILLLLISSLSYSQTSKDIVDRKHEIKLGVLKALLVETVDVEYEYLLNSSSSLGTNAIFYGGDTDLNFSFAPYYRFYFTENKDYGSKGFFGQVIANYYTGKSVPSDTIFSEGIEAKKSFNAVSLGFGVGKKWVNKIGIVYQIQAGFGRKIIGSNYSPEFSGNLDVSVGYRF